MSRHLKLHFQGNTPDVSASMTVPHTRVVSVIERYRSAIDRFFSKGVKAEEMPHMEGNQNSYMSQSTPLSRLI